MILATTRVEEVDRFLDIFSTKGAEKRQQHGSKGSTVFRDPNEEDRVWALFDWDAEGWTSFVSDPDVPAILQEAGHVGKPQAAEILGQSTTRSPPMVGRRREAVSTTQRRDGEMKYMLSWSERAQGSPMEYENAQKRILEVFTQWKAPDEFMIEEFVIRVGDWGGYMLVECDDPLTVHKFCSTLPAFTFEARPVVPVMDAVRVELEAIDWRDGVNVR